MLAALNHLKSHPKIDNTNLFLFGQSLGGAISLDLYARRPYDFNGIILENTFTSLRALVKEKISILKPLRSALSEPWDNLLSIETLSSQYKKVWLLSGRKDDFIIPEHMDTIYERFLENKTNDANEVKMIHFENGKHIEMYNEPGYYGVFKRFFYKNNLN